MKANEIRSARLFRKTYPLSVRYNERKYKKIHTQYTWREIVFHWSIEFQKNDTKRSTEIVAQHNKWSLFT